MYHEWREVALVQVWAMSKDDFLQACSEYLEEALAEDKRRSDDAEAKAYLRGRPERGKDGDDWNYSDNIC